MNTKKMAIASAVGVFAVLAMLVAYPAMAASPAASPNSTSNLHQMLQRSAYMSAQKVQLNTGQTITLTSVAGGYWVVGHPASNGTASGTMTLQVSGSLARGFILSITGGSFTINGTTYTISRGSAELGPYGLCMVGNGQAGTGQFLFMDRNLGKFGSSSYGVLRVDLKDGMSEFAARLLVTVSA